MMEIRHTYYAGNTWLCLRVIYPVYEYMYIPDTWYVKYQECLQFDMYTCTCSIKYSLHETHFWGGGGDGIH